ncbi:MAG: rhomboid family intramembrane serine protease [Dokdonella sp.]|uniref:rhomboid family intramembrane serine protease n=1 Tax=Dokdonella sp. TaxID=2291710 RepID=UPI0025C59BBF|nr:rhomboid family intramembrane serine protease [Dokdonella sp.]MBZ0222678.1 rhomboid family intramembrane serine protease [Dokdonella sp.]MCC7256251.1 rhomboid family intramembrane serine protease [Dokdonella sp.]
MFVQLPSRRRSALPLATLLIVAACVVVFLWLASLPTEQRAATITHWGTVPTTLLDSNTAWLQQLLELRAMRLVSALFIHADWLHLTGNLLFLIVFGVSAERVLGSLRFLLLFVLGGALANLFGALMLAGTSAPIIGSSGAVSAVVGAYLALFPRARLGLVLPLGFFLEFVRVPAVLLIGFWAALQLLFTYVGPAFGAVAWWTHVGGFIIGIALALLSRPAIARRLRQ